MHRTDSNFIFRTSNVRDKTYGIERVYLLAILLKHPIFGFKRSNIELWTNVFCFRMTRLRTLYNVRSYQKPRCFEKCTFFVVWRMLHPCVRTMTWDKPLNNFSECFFMMTSCSSTFFSISNLHIHERREGGGGKLMEMQMLN